MPPPGIRFPRRARRVGVAAPSTPRAHRAPLGRLRAIGRDTDIDPAVASDGVDEYLSMMLPRRIIRDGGALPLSSLHVHCTDTSGEWLVWSAGNELQLRREHAKGDAALRGTAQALLLSLWGRRHRSPAIDIVGDPVAAEAWLALGG